MKETCDSCGCESKCSREQENTASMRALFKALADGPTDWGERRLARAEKDGDLTVVFTLCLYCQDLKRQLEGA